MITTSNPVKCDILVVGSGAAGLATAIKAAKEGLSVIVAEKEKYLGGTSAISGGWMWLPGNKQGVAEGDTREEIELYIKNLAGDSYNAAAVKAFLDEVPEAMSFFESETEVEFVYPNMAPDYQMDTPGAKPKGRAVTVKRADGRKLKENRLRLRPYLSTFTVFGYMPEVGPDIQQFVRANQSLKSFIYVSRKLLRTWVETVLFRRAFMRTNGNALMARLVQTADDLGIRMWTNSPVVKLNTSTDGVIDGAVVDGEHACAVQARLSVVLAAGGYGADKTLRQATFPHDHNGDNHITATVGHEGNSLKLAQPLGGVLDTSPHSSAAWAPVTVFYSLRGQQRIFPHLRAFGLPGQIAVDRHGERFANESDSYHDFGTKMIKHNEGEPDTFSYIIADQKAMHKYGIGYAKPWPVPQGYFKKTGYLIEANSLEELAHKTDINAEGLKRTVAEFNEGARNGEDPKFNRGSSQYHHFKGDMEHKPNPNLAPLDKAPYYAAKIQMGDLGTYAGLAVTPRSEVVTEDGRVIPGLYAVGTAAMSVFRGGYPGYGAMLGPAMVFGYTVGRDIAKHAAERGEPRAAAVTRDREPSEKGF